MSDLRSGLRLLGGHRMSGSLWLGRKLPLAKAFASWASLTSRCCSAIVSPPTYTFSDGCSGLTPNVCGVGKSSSSLPSLTYSGTVLRHRPISSASSAVRAPGKATASRSASGRGLSGWPSDCTTCPNMLKVSGGLPPLVEIT